MSASNPINFADYFKGGEVITDAAKQVRLLQAAIRQLAVNVVEDGNRIKAGLADATAGLVAIQQKMPTLKLTTPAEKKELSDLIQQVGELKAKRQELEAQEKSGASIQKVLSDASKAATAALKEQQAAFVAASAAGNAEGQKKAATAILELKTNATEAAAAIRGANTSYTAAGGSINELRLQLSKGTAAYNALTESERNNAETGIKLRDSNKSLSDQLKTVEKGIGDNRRSVGAYADGIVEASARLGGFKGVLGEVGGPVLGLFSGQINQAKELAERFKSGLDHVKGGLLGMKTGTDTAVEGTKALKIGLIETGIGIFILALSAVISYLTGTNEGSKLLKQGLAALGAVVTSVSNVVFGLGKGLVAAAKDPQQAFQDLVDFLKSQVINRFASFGVILEGIEKHDFKQVANGILQLNTGVTNSIDKVQAYGKGLKDAAVNAGELEAESQKLRKARAELEIKDEAEKGRVRELILLSKDRTLSAAERLGKLREAGKIEKELSDEAIHQTNAELSALQRRNAQKGLSTSAEEIQQERDKRKELVVTDNERKETLATIRARSSRFILEESAELKKAQKERADAAQKAREDAAKAQKTALLIQLGNVAQGSEAELRISQKLVDAETALKLAGEKKRIKERELIVQEGEHAKQKLQQEFDKKAAEEVKKANEQEKQRAAKLLAEKEREYSEAVKLLNDYTAKRKAAVEAQYVSDLRAAGSSAKKIAEAKEAEQAALLQVEQKGLDALLVVNKYYLKNVGDAEEKQAQANIKRQEAETKKLQEEVKKRVAIVDKVAATINKINDYSSQFQAQRLDNQAAAEEKNYERQIKAAGNNTLLKQRIEEDHSRKVAALNRRKAQQDQDNAAFHVKIDTAAAVAKAYFESPATFGLPFSAVALANGAIQLALIYGQKIPEFFTGRRGGGMVPIASVAERGPELIQRAATGRFEYAAKPTYTSLGQGDSVYTAQETSKLLTTAGLTQHEAQQQPARVTAALTGAAQAAHSGRTGGQQADTATNQHLLRAIEGNTAAMQKLKQVTVNVGPGSDASVQSSAGLTRYLNQRTFS